MSLLEPRAICGRYWRSASGQGRSPPIRRDATKDPRAALQPPHREGLRPPGSAVHPISPASAPTHARPSGDRTDQGRSLYGRGRARVVQGKKDRASRCVSACTAELLPVFGLRECSKDVVEKGLGVHEGGFDLVLGDVDDVPVVEAVPESADVVQPSPSCVLALDGCARDTGTSSCGDLLIRPVDSRRLPVLHVPARTRPRTQQRIG
jgi:hypothetical protein